MFDNCWWHCSTASSLIPSNQSHRIPTASHNSFFCYILQFSLLSSLSRQQQNVEMKWKIVKKYYFIFLLVLIVYRRSFNRKKVVEVIGWDSIRIPILLCGILVDALNNLLLCNNKAKKLKFVFWCWTIYYVKVMEILPVMNFIVIYEQNLKEFDLIKQKNVILFNRNKIKKIVIKFSASNKLKFKHLGFSSKSGSIKFWWVLLFLN